MRHWPVSYRIIKVDANSKLSGAAWGHDRKAERAEVAEPCRAGGGTDRHTASRNLPLHLRSALPKRTVKSQWSRFLESGGERSLHGDQWVWNQPHRDWH